MCDQNCLWQSHNDSECSTKCNKNRIKTFNLLLPQDSIKQDDDEREEWNEKRLKCFVASENFGNQFHSQMFIQSLHSLNMVYILYVADGLIVGRFKIINKATELLTALICKKYLYFQSFVEREVLSILNKDDNPSDKVLVDTLNPFVITI